jgi:amino acid transporter
MVAYTAPVFWLFLLLSTLSLMVLRKRQSAKTPVPHYRVPFYPLPPLMFAACCLFMGSQSLLYAGSGAVVGVIVLLTGLPLVLYRRYRASLSQKESR